MARRTGPSGQLPEPTRLRRVKGHNRKMVIGRSDERNTPDDARAHCDTAWLLRVRSRKPSGPAVMTPHRKAGHMIAPDPAPTLLQSALETRGPFSNRASLVNSLLSFCCRPGVTVLSAVGVVRRNIWSEAQALQCPQRARMIFDAAQGPLAQLPAPSPRRAIVTSEATLRMDLGE